MKLCLFILSFILSGLPGQVHSQNIDSLRNAFEQATLPEDKISLAIDLGNHYFYAQQDSAEYFFDAARKLLPAKGYDSLYVLTYERSSALFEVSGRFRDALDTVYKAWHRVKQSGLDAKTDQMYVLLGRYHMRLTHYDSAAYYWTLLLESKDKKGDTYLKWLPYHYLGGMYSDIGDWEKGKSYFEKALACVRTEKRPKDYPYLLYLAMNMAELQRDMDTYSKWRNEYLEYKVTQKTKILDSEHSTVMQVNESPAQRRKQLMTYLPYHVSNKSYFSACDTWYRIGQTYLQEKQYEQAIEALTTMLRYTDTINAPTLKHNGHLEMYKAYLAMEDYKNALTQFEIVYTMWDTLTNRDRQKMMNELNVKYETAEKEKQLAETSLHLETSRKNQQLLTLGLLGALVVSGLSYYALRLKKRSNRELEEKNKAISKALNEKDILLREIHHRVKNNLQMISALLYLHGKSVDDSTAQEALKESQNRVQSMAIIHQNLYQQDNLLGVSIAEYLDKLLNHLISSYNIEANRISVHTKIEVPQLDVDTVIPLALIINELISNSLKYAFRDGRKGDIWVSIESGEGQLHVHVSDNGVGLPENFSPGQSGNFGLKLINILCDRLGATWSAQNQGGTSVSILIPLKQAA